MKNVYELNNSNAIANINCFSVLMCQQWIPICNSEENRHFIQEWQLDTNFIPSTFNSSSKMLGAS